jgi:hypothetical protein
MQRRFIVINRHFGTVCWSHLQGSGSQRRMPNNRWIHFTHTHTHTHLLPSSVLGLLDSCHKMLVNNYQSMLRNSPEEQRPQLHCGRSLKSCKLIFINLTATVFYWTTSVRNSGTSSLSLKDESSCLFLLLRNCLFTTLIPVAL